MITLFVGSGLLLVLLAGIGIGREWAALKREIKQAVRRW